MSVRPIPIFLPLALLTQACLVSPLEEQAHVSLSLSLPPPAAGSVLAASGSNNPFDKQDLFHLDVFPKLVRVSVELEDYELTSATWPDPQDGVGQGEGTSGEVELDLIVPASQPLRLRALGLIHELDQVLVYREEKVQTVNLVAGRTEARTISMIRHESGTLSAIVRCEYGNIGDWLPYRLSIVDARAAAVYPPVKLTVDPDSGALKAKIPGAPVGRPFWARIYVINTLGDVKFLDQRIPTFQLDTANELTPVTLTVPCHLLP